MYFLNWMGPDSKAWCDEHGEHWCGGRIDLPPTEDDPFGVEYGVDIMHSEDWVALRVWLASLEDKQPRPYKQLFSDFEEHLGRKVRWWKDETSDRS